MLAENRKGCGGLGLLRVLSSQILSLNQEGLDSTEPGKDLAGQARGGKIGGSVPGRHQGGWC